MDNYGKASFAMMSRLKPFFQCAQIKESDVWEYLKASRGNKTSRADFTDEDWAIVHSRLFTAVWFPSVRVSLIEEVKKFLKVAN